MNGELGTWVQDQNTSQWTLTAQLNFILKQNPFSIGDYLM